MGPGSYLLKLIAGIASVILPHSYCIVDLTTVSGIVITSNEKLMPVDSMQEQEGRNAGPVHEPPLRQSARPADERATMRRTVCVVGAARLFTKHHTMGADEQDYTDTAAYAE